MQKHSDEKKKVILPRYVREPVAIIIWLYLVTKIFAYDLDIYLIDQYAPALKPLIKYKFFLFLGLVSCCWILVGKKRFPLFALYILAYPFIILFWKLPKLIFYNSELGIVFLPAVFDVASEFRTHFLCFSMVAFSGLLISISSDQYILIASMAFMIGVYIFYMKKVLMKSYKANIFGKMADVLSLYGKKLSDITYLNGLIYNYSAKSSDAAKVEHMQGNQDSETPSKLTTLYIFHSIAALLSEKIDNVSKSGRIEIYLISAWMFSLLFTWLTFTFEYFALYKIDASSFAFSQTRDIITFFSFLAFSFGKIIPNNIFTIIPNSFLAEAFSYLQIVCSFTLLIVFLRTMFATARENYKKDLSQVAAEITGIADTLQNSFQKIFNLALSDAETKLLIHNKTFVNFVRKARGLTELTPPKTIENTTPSTKVQTTYSPPSERTDAQTPLKPPSS